MVAPGFHGPIIVVSAAVVYEPGSVQVDEVVPYLVFAAPDHMGASDASALDGSAGVHISYERVPESAFLQRSEERGGAVVSTSLLEDVISSAEYPSILGSFASIPTMSGLISSTASA